MLVCVLCNHYQFLSLVHFFIETMSSKRARSSPSERQVQSNGVKQSLTHNDSIERLVDELLDSGKGNKNLGCIAGLSIKILEGV